MMKSVNNNNISKANTKVDYAFDCAYTAHMQGVADNMIHFNPKVESIQLGSDKYSNNLTISNHEFLLAKVCPQGM